MRALVVGGAIQCWGDNGYGQLGDGTNDDAPPQSPVFVSGMAGATQVNAGYNKTCALMPGGMVECWGDGADGQLGNGSDLDSTVPVEVVGITGADSLAIGAGGATCVLMPGGTIKCWGANWGGQLGDGTNVPSNVPVDVVGITDATAVSTGWAHGCAVVGGAAKCWGYNFRGQLGDGTFVDSNVPVGVSGLTSGVSMVSAGDEHSCALMAAGGTRCWGRNDSGQLGNSTITSSPPFAVGVPVVTQLNGALQIDVGGYHACATMPAGTVSCWGSHAFGQLGYSPSGGGDSPTPMSVVGIP